jgi:predicted CoA-binding protein
LTEASEWMANLVTDREGARDILAGARRIAVLGIKPESRAWKPAHFVPKYLQDQGYDIVPVPTYYPGVTEILGEPVFREVAAIPGDIDIVNVFRRSHDIPPHVEDIIRKGPAAVWFQAGIRNDRAAEQLARAGIRVVQDRCTMADHRSFGLRGLAED